MSRKESDVGKAHRERMEFINRYPSTVSICLDRPGSEFWVDWIGDNAGRWVRIDVIVGNRKVVHMLIEEGDARRLAKKILDTGDS